MKKLLALFLTLALVFSCLPGTAMAEKYKSTLLKKTINLPSQMALVNEEKLSEASGVQLTITVENQPSAVIYTTVQKIESFKGYTVSTLPEAQFDAWTEYYYQYYPENAAVDLLRSNSGKGDALYCYYGQGANGGSILVYISVQGQICVTSS